MSSIESLNSLEMADREDSTFWEISCSSGLHLVRYFCTTVKVCASENRAERKEKGEDWVRQEQGTASDSSDSHTGERHGIKYTVPRRVGQKPLKISDSFSFFLIYLELIFQMFHSRIDSFGNAPKRTRRRQAYSTPHR